MMFSAAPRMSAQMGGGGQNYAPQGHPTTTTSHSSSQTLETRREYGQQQSGAARASIAISAEEKGGGAVAFPTKTPKLFATFQTHGTTKGDNIRAVWVRQSDKKGLYQTKMIGNQNDFGGTVSINAPPAGWPAGKYEVELFVNDKIVGKAVFAMKNSE